MQYSSDRRWQNMLCKMIVKVLNSPGTVSSLISVSYILCICVTDIQSLFYWPGLKFPDQADDNVLS